MACLFVLQKLQAATDLLNIFSAVMHADKDGDGQVNDSEIDHFLTRMKAYAGNNWKSTNEDNIRAAFKSSLSKRGETLFNITAATLEEEKKMEEPPLVRTASPRAPPKPEVVHQVRKLPAVTATGLVMPTTEFLETEGKYTV